ncbi:MAG: class I SAM-dependent methyltransferase [bacterium]|nr:class I SAM-dependent methyltransferase [bacterium]
MTDLFKEKAKEWDQNSLVAQLSKAISQSIIDEVALHPQMHVLDFGAGTGMITSKIAPYVQKVTAVDVSQAMLEQLLAKQELKGKVEILCQNMVHVPTGEFYDLIMSAMAMHHVEDTEKMIAQFAEHLKAGGQVALADLDEEDGSFHPAGTQGVFHSGIRRDYLQGLLETYGFEQVRFVTAFEAVKETNTYPIFLALATKA